MGYESDLQCGRKLFSFPGFRGAGLIISWKKRARKRRKQCYNATFSSFAEGPIIKLKCIDFHDFSFSRIWMTAIIKLKTRYTLFERDTYFFAVRLRTLDY